MTQPTSSAIEASVRYQNGVAIVDMQGEINAEADEALSSAYAAAAERDAKTVLLNFTDVSYINSTGIALIVGVLAEARKAQRSVSTFGLSDHYVEIFQITRLSDFMGIHADEASALSETT